ncbi:MAG: hypothetical protein ACKVH8_06590 [Pirellulales bacterium]
MGVDITLFAEQRLADGKWSIVCNLIPNLNYFPDDPDFPDEPELVPPTIDIPRCSPLFAILANVNNSRTAVPYETIALPRGIPEDASPETRVWFNAWGDDAFAPSWLTLDEIDSFNWDRVTQQYGHVDARAAHLFNGNPMGFPFTAWPEGLELSYSISATDSGNARWRATYAESAGFKWFRELLRPFEQYQTLRFIFWFDH